MKSNLIIIAVIALLLGGGAGFFAGIQYQKNQRSSFFNGTNQRFNGRMNQQPGNGFRAGGAMGRPVSGEITSLDENTLTIKTQDGSSKIVVYSSSTKVNKSSEGSTVDLKVGEQVTVFGSQSAEGTVTAQSISLGSSLFFGLPSGTPPGQN